MGLELFSAFGSTAERIFFSPYFNSKTFLKHRKVCLCGMLYFIDGEICEGYNNIKKVERNIYGSDFSSNFRIYFN